MSKSEKKKVTLTLLLIRNSALWPFSDSFRAGTILSSEGGLGFISSSSLRIPRKSCIFLIRYPNIWRHQAGISRLSSVSATSSVTGKKLSISIIQEKHMYFHILEMNWKSNVFHHETYLRASQKKGQIKWRQENMRIQDSNAHRPFLILSIPFV